MPLKNCPVLKLMLFVFQLKDTKCASYEHPLFMRCVSLEALCVTECRKCSKFAISHRMYKYSKFAIITLKPNFPLSILPSVNPKKP